MEQDLREKRQGKQWPRHYCLVILLKQFSDPYLEGGLLLNLPIPNCRPDPVLDIVNTFELMVQRSYVNASDQGDLFQKALDEILGVPDLSLSEIGKGCPGHIT